jgi:hypothetical protein
VLQATAAAVGALGLSEGPFHAELRVPGAAAERGGAVPGDAVPVRAAASRGGSADAAVPGDAVKVLEVAARTIGGRCSKAMLMEDGSSLEELVIANALGAPYPPPRLASPCGVLMLPIPRSGTLRSVGGADEVRALPCITGVEITIPIGRPVRALPEGDRYLGFVFAAGESRAGVEEALRTAERLLVVEIEPEDVARPRSDEPADTVS